MEGKVWRGRPLVDKGESDGAMRQSADETTRRSRSHLDIG